MSRWYPCCDEEFDCEACGLNFGDMPSSFDIDVAGITNGSCSSCGGLNGTFTLNQLAGTCVYLLNVSNPCYSPVQWRLSFEYDATLDESRIRVELNGSLVPQATFLKTVSGKAGFACDTLSAESVPHSSSNDSVCDFSSATVDVTAN